LDAQRPLVNRGADLSTFSAKHLTTEIFDDLQGLRGVAVLLVVLYHAAVPGLPGGYVGVDMFFVISGYLITDLLFRERQRTGTISFAQFYARRARRLLPAAGLAILVTLVCSWFLFAPIEQRGHASSALAASLYFSNIWFASAANDYFAGVSEANPFLHTWSLSVEEQFYLLWPALIFLAAKGVARERVRSRLVLVLVIVSAVSLAVCGYLTSVNQPWAFFSMPTRIWEFGLGAVGVLVLPRGDRLRPYVSGMMNWTGALLVIWAATRFTRDTAFPGFAALVPAVGAGLLLGAGRGEAPGPVSRLLSTSPIRWLGDVSYSWYLWHWPAIVMTREFVSDSPLALSLAVAGSLALSAVSYRLVENPIRRSPALAARVWGSLAGGAVVALLGGATAFLAHDVAKRAMATPRQQLYSDANDDKPLTGKCHAMYPEIDLPDCAFGDLQSSRTVVLLGDSHAQQWFPAVESVAAQLGARFVSLTKSSCVPVDVPAYLARMNRPYYECDAWREAMLSRIAAMRPLLTIISSASYGDMAAGGGRAPLPEAQWERGLDTVIARLNGAGIPVLVIHDTPSPGMKVPACLARAAWHGRAGACAFMLVPDVAARANMRAVNRSVARQRDAFAVDFTGIICPRTPCDTERDGYVLYSDESHLTARFSRSLGDTLAARIKDYAESRPDSRVSQLFVQARNSKHFGHAALQVEIDSFASRVSGSEGYFRLATTPPHGNP